MKKVFNLKILQPKFDKVYKRFEANVQKMEEQKKADETLQSLANQQQATQKTFWQEYERKQKERREENERAFQQRVERESKEKAQKEELKAKRVADNGGNLLLYIVDRIIDMCVMRDGSERIEMDIDYLGIPNDLTQVTNVHNFFNKLKNYGCFATVERSSNMWFIITDPNLGKLHSYKTRLKNILAISPTNTDRLVESNTNVVPFMIAVMVKDREIWISKYLIGKPHAIGSNFEFFEYIRSQKPNTKINRETLPDFSGSLSLKEQVKSKSFIKIVNELGFKGEILKAFFYNRGKDTLTYRGNQITKEDLEKAGVKISLFLKELELAHIRNSPE